MTRYLIIGAGMTGDAAARGIRARDAGAEIVLVGAEKDPPYKRPPLTKGLWSGGDESKIWKDDAHDADVRLGRRIVSIDLDAHTAVDDLGDDYAWDKLLLATGGTPRRLLGTDAVVYYRTLEDFRRLRAKVEAGTRVVVIGGGFIGSEIAAALRNNGAEVTMVFPDDAIGSRLFPAALAQTVTEDYRRRGVEVLTGETVAGVDGNTVTTKSGRALAADVVVAGLGIQPETELATAAGLPVDNGILVDEYGRVDGRDDVFAAGDVANFPSPVLGRRFRIEHEDHANTHGKVVGGNMAGAGEVYDHLPFFYSDLFDAGYEAVGELDSRLATVERWETPNAKGVVAYVDDAGRPRGFLLWDTWGKVDAARALLVAGDPVTEESLDL